MFSLKLCLKCIENHFLASSFGLVVFLTLVYFSNFFRICYYVYKIPGPRAYPLIGNGLMFLGSHKEINERLYQIVDGRIPVSRIWVGPIPIVFTINPQFAQEILTNQNGLEKPQFVRTFAKPVIRDAILMAKVGKWKRNRSVVIRGFSPAVLKTYFNVFVEKSLLLTEVLNKHLNESQSFNIFEYITKTSVDSICGSTMGVNVHALKHGTAYFNAMESCMYLLADRGINPIKYSDLLYRFTNDYKQLKKSASVIQGLAKKVIIEKQNSNSLNSVNNNLDSKIDRLDKNSLKKPLLDYLIDYSKNVPEFTNEDLQDETNLVIMAGYETSANAISYVLINLAARKEIEKKVCAELFSVVGDRTIELDDLPKLEYMELVIKESMRLYSTIPLIARQLSNDIKIDKYIIPKGCYCAIPLFCLHRDPGIWDDPLKFDPERFRIENCKSRHPYAYIPFSGGPRNCIGGRYAMMFMKTILATLLSRYEFHTDLNINKLKLQMEVSLKLIGGHQVRITPRNR